MPLYEYECLKCGERFELLVLPGRETACPQCANRELERVPSLFAVSSAALRQSHENSARKHNLSLERDKKRVEIDDPHRH